MSNTRVICTQFARCVIMNKDIKFYDSVKISTSKNHHRKQKTGNSAVNRVSCTMRTSPVRREAHDVPLLSTLSTSWQVNPVYRLPSSVRSLRTYRHQSTVLPIWQASFTRVDTLFNNHHKITSELCSSPILRSPCLHLVRISSTHHILCQSLHTGNLTSHISTHIWTKCRSHFCVVKTISITISKYALIKIQCHYRTVLGELCDNALDALHSHNVCKGHHFYNYLFGL